VSANERYQCRCIHRSHNHRSWNPAPRVAGVSPSSVVEWREARRLIFYPGPSPRLDEIPVPVTIRSPALRNSTRHPHVAVVGDVAPAPVVVEIVIAGHFRRDIVLAIVTILTAVAVKPPVFEIVIAGRARDIVTQFVSSRE